MKEFITQHISIEIGATRFRRGRQKRLVGGGEARHIVRDFALDGMEDILWVRVEFAHGHCAINGPKGLHDRQFRGVPHYFRQDHHVHILLLEERLEPMLAVVTHEAFGGVPGEADAPHDVLVFTDPCGDLLYSLWSGWALPGPATDPKFLEDENGEDVGDPCGCLADLVVFEGSLEEGLGHCCWLLGRGMGDQFYVGSKGRG